MANHTTGAQRHNKRQDKIWEFYKQQQRDKAEATLKEYFSPINGVIDPFGRTYNAEPMFQQREVNKNDLMASEIEENHQRIRVRRYSPISNTKNYLVAYQILSA